MASAAEIFGRAIEMSPARRARFVQRCTADDPALRDEVESLLAAHAVMGRFLAAAPPLAPTSTDEPSADAVPGHRLLQKLGEGGFGTVHLALELGALEREVAIKFLKRERLHPKALERFDAERRILATLQHDGIARIYTAGTTAQGCPYYTMEWVDGLPIDADCDEARLRIRDRVALFVPVCRAVAYAHQRGVIHGDLKPHNVLVCRHAGDPSPKIIDFGVARSLGASPTGEQPAGGTPRYMSPEQRSGAAADARCDIYSLGVLLHDLLVGRRNTAGPLQHTLLDLRADVGAEQARLRGVSEAGLRRQLDGDLAHVVGRATSTAPERRYETVRELIVDLEAWLQRRPLPSRPRRLAYVLSRWFARHPFAGMSTVVLASACCLWAWNEGRNARLIAASKRAAEAWSEASEDSLELLEDVMMAASPSRDGPDAPLSRVVDLAEQRLEATPPGQPLVSARLGLLLGSLRMRFGDREGAVALLRRAAADARRSAEVTALDLAYLDVMLAHAIGRGHHDEESRRLLTQALAVVEALPDDDRAFRVRQLARRSLAFGELHEGRPRELLLRLRTLHAETTARLGPDDTLSIEIAQLLANAELDYGRPDETGSRSAGPVPSPHADAAGDHAWSLGVHGRIVEARTAMRDGEATRAGGIASDVLRLLEARGAGTTAHALAAREILAAVATQAKDHERSLEHLRAIFELERQRHGAGHRQTLRAVRNVAAALSNLNRLDEADAFLAEHCPDEDAEAVDATQRTSLLEVRAMIASRRGRPDDALRMWDQVVASNVRALGARQIQTVESRRRRAVSSAEAGQTERALAELAELAEQTREDFGALAKATFDVQGSIATVLAGAARIDEAQAVLETRLDAVVAGLGAAHDLVFVAARDLGGFALEHGRMASFDAAAARVTAVFRRSLAEEPERESLRAALGRFQAMLDAAAGSRGGR